MQAALPAGIGWPLAQQELAGPSPRRPLAPAAPRPGGLMSLGGSSGVDSSQTCPPAGEEARQAAEASARWLVLAGPARYDWRHSIPARKSDRVGDQVISRGRRVSLTFRTVEGTAA